MAFTGLFLCLFLVIHLSGNLLLLKGDGGAAFNHYAEFMATNWVIRFMEIFLVLGFAIHILDGIVLSWQGKQARPHPYQLQKAGETATWSSRYMIFTGLLILIFLGIHLWSFTIRHRVLGASEPMNVSVQRAFENPWYSAFYIFAFFLLGLHLYHGFQSAFQSLGLNHKKYTPCIQALGMAFCVLIPLGYATIPVYFLLQKGKNSQTAFVEVQLPPKEVAKLKETALAVAKKEFPNLQKMQILKIERNPQFLRLTLEVTLPNGQKKKIFFGVKQGAKNNG